jgi:signal transduction histidine kinase
VRADPDRLQQVLTNLLDNALRHSPPGPPVDVSLATVDGEAVVAVRDQGPGIAPDDAERIFQKFVRGRSTVAGGSGLGLYISRRIVDAHSGRIWVSSADGAGAGAELSMALPRVATPAD